MLVWRCGAVVYLLALTVACTTAAPKAGRGAFRGSAIGGMAGHQQEDIGKISGGACMTVLFPWRVLFRIDRTSPVLHYRLGSI
jgi:hypothetical protein